MASAGQNSGDLEWPVARVRSTFVEFFVGKQHTAVSSSPVVPVNDPTLLFRQGSSQGRTAGGWRMPSAQRCRGGGRGWQHRRRLPRRRSPPLRSPTPLQPMPRLQQCGHEPVQAHLPGHGRPQL